jgi:hypothetical protein
LAGVYLTAFEDLWQTCIPFTQNDWNNR